MFLRTQNIFLLRDQLMIFNFFSKMFFFFCWKACLVSENNVFKIVIKYGVEEE